MLTTAERWLSMKRLVGDWDEPNHSASAGKRENIQKEKHEKRKKHEHK